MTQYTPEGYRPWYESTCSIQAGIYVTNIYGFSLYLAENTKFVYKIHILLSFK